MDTIKTARKIGLFESARNIAAVMESVEVCCKVEEAMPVPGADFAPCIEGAVDYLLGFGKRKLLFLSPEIALMEALAARNVPGLQVFVAMPQDMDPQEREQVMANVPGKIGVQFLEELYFPEFFFPGDGMIVSFGYLAGDRLMALPECYRMTDRYSRWWGKKVFVPYVVRQDATRFPNWLELNPGIFSDIWRQENCE